MGGAAGETRWSHTGGLLKLRGWHTRFYFTTRCTLVLARKLTNTNFNEKHSKLLFSEI